MGVPASQPPPDHAPPYSSITSTTAVRRRRCRDHRAAGRRKGRRRGLPGTRRRGHRSSCARTAPGPRATTAVPARRRRRRSSSSSSPMVTGSIVPPDGHGLHLPPIDTGSGGWTGRHELTASGRCECVGRLARSRSRGRGPGALGFRRARAPARSAGAVRAVEAHISATSARRFIGSPPPSRTARPGSPLARYAGDGPPRRRRRDRSQLDAGRRELVTSTRWTDWVEPSHTIERPYCSGSVQRRCAGPSCPSRCPSTRRHGASSSRTRWTAHRR